jgi:hypothetical protein
LKRSLVIIFVAIVKFLLPFVLVLILVLVLIDLPIQGSLWPGFFCCSLHSNNIRPVQRTYE